MNTIVFIIVGRQPGDREGTEAKKPLTLNLFLRKNGDPARTCNDVPAKVRDFLSNSGPVPDAARNTARTRQEWTAGTHSDDRVTRFPREFWDLEAPARVELAMEVLQN